MSIASFFKTQTLFLTGVSGFIGKVLLARLLDVAVPTKIYVLLRWKRKPPYQRLQELLAGECFDYVRENKNMSLDEFMAWANNIISICEGDMQQPKIGMSDSDLKKIAKETTVIIHNAASVRFEETIKESLVANVYGSLQLLDIAKTCTKLVSYVHVSTSYVNSNISKADSTGKIHINEKLYPTDFDPEEMYQKLLNEDISKTMEKQILGNHPNVYTFTKNLTEQLINGRRGSLPMAFVRPSMVGVAYRHPYTGWYDNISAVGGLVILSGLGVLRFFPDLGDRIIDQIPVDYTVDTYLATAMYRARQPIGPDTDITIVHSTSSSLNPCDMRQAMLDVLAYWNSLDARLPHNLRKPKVTEIKVGLHSRVVLDTLPWKLTHSICKLIPSRRVRKMTGLLNQAADRARLVSFYFKYFMTNSWVNDSSTLLTIKNSLTEADQETFSLDPSDICWKHFMNLFCYGIRRYVLNEDCELPTIDLDDPLNGDFEQVKIGLESVNTLPFHTPLSSTYNPRVRSKL